VTGFRKSKNHIPPPPPITHMTDTTDDRQSHDSHPDISLLQVQAPRFSFSLWLGACAGLTLSLRQTFRLSKNEISFLQKMDATNWTYDHTAALQSALRLFPASLPKEERWQRIAQHVGKPTKECVARYKLIANEIQARSGGSPPAPVCASGAGDRGGAAGSSAGGSGGGVVSSAARGGGSGPNLSSPGAFG